MMTDESFFFDEKTKMTQEVIISLEDQAVDISTDKTLKDLLIFSMIQAK